MFLVLPHTQLFHLLVFIHCFARYVYEVSLGSWHLLVHVLLQSCFLFSGVGVGAGGWAPPGNVEGMTSSHCAVCILVLYVFILYWLWTTRRTTSRLLESTLPSCDLRLRLLHHLMVFGHVDKLLTARLYFKPSHIYTLVFKFRRYAQVPGTIAQ